MNILHISPYVPSVHASHAGGVCMGKQVETLSKRHNVYVMGFINDDKDEILAKEYDENKSYFVKSTTLTKSINALLHLNIPLMFGIRNSLSFKRKIVKVIQEYNIDCIHAEFTAMGQYYYLKKKFPNLKFNLVEHDVAIQSYERKNSDSFLGKILDKWQLSLVKKIEKEYVQNADVVFVTNEKDKILINNRYGITDAHVIIPYYGIDTFGPQGNKKETNSICFVGNMSRIENDLAAKRLINIFNDMKLENSKLYIIGAYPSKELQAMSSDNIIVTGFVEKIEDIIDKCEIAVFPLDYGAGIKLKVLLAFGLGLPVITTDIGAEGIDEDGEVLMLVNTDEQIKNSILQLINNKDFYNNKSKDSIKYVKKHFGWEKTESLFEKIYH